MERWKGIQQNNTMRKLTLVWFIFELDAMSPVLTGEIPETLIFSTSCSVTTIQSALQSLVVVGAHKCYIHRVKTQGSSVLQGRKLKKNVLKV